MVAILPDKGEVILYAGPPPQFILLEEKTEK